METKEKILSTFTSREGAWFAYREGVQTGYYEAYNSLRNQAAIAAMQGVINCFGNIDYNKETFARLAVELADALIEELKKELTMDKKESEIPFGAFDSELMHQEINIPEGFEAEIKGNKIILKKTESDDKKIKNAIEAILNDTEPHIYNGLGVLKTDILVWLEKQGKPTDKVKPKFHEGEWVVFNNRHDSVYQVEKIENYEYTLRHFLGGSMPLSFSHEDMIRAWTVKDVRDGDVLADKTDGVIGIFQSIGHHPDGGSFNDPSYCFLHCRYDDGYFYADFENGNTMDSDDAIPATKEQRDTLFAKMKEAGYEWDANKKELRQIACDKFIRKEMYFDFDRELVKYIEDDNAFIKDDYVVEKNNGDSFNHIYDLEGVAKHFFKPGLSQQNDKQNE